ncbi:hypothetical protein BJY52DRAFT_644702 [Lactarius psammicola]|nr:hypothetical protein BJY52DRAFT_644702 [Lactarius psammicola]
MSVRPNGSAENCQEGRPKPGKALLELSKLSSCLLQFLRVGRQPRRRRRRRSSQRKNYECRESTDDRRMFQLWPTWALGKRASHAHATSYTHTHIACPAGNQRNNMKRSKTTIPSKSRGTGSTGPGGAECFKCGKNGHYSKDCPDPGFPTGASRGSSRKASSSRGTSRGRGRGGKKAVSKPRSKTGAFRAADDDWD